MVDRTTIQEAHHFGIALKGDKVGTVNWTARTERESLGLQNCQGEYPPILGSSLAEKMSESGSSLIWIGAFQPTFILPVP